MCGCMVDIHSAKAEIRRGKKKSENRRKKKTTGQKIWCPHLLSRAALIIIIMPLMFYGELVTSSWIRPAYLQTRRLVAANLQSKPTGLGGEIAYRPRQQSSLIIVTSSENCYSIYRPTEDGRLSQLRHCSKGVLPVPRAVNRHTNTSSAMVPNSSEVKSIELGPQG